MGFKFIFKKKKKPHLTMSGQSSSTSLQLRVSALDSEHWNGYLVTYFVFTDYYVLS